MNKRQISLFFAFLTTTFFLLSWGVTGHRTIGRIAERHLSPNAKAAIQALLGTETLSDVSTWADEVRGQPGYEQTGPWHYLNLPLGLTYPAFAQQVEGMTQDNVYKSVLAQERTLNDKSAPRQTRIEALKFVVHFVGDLHQPMHVSRAEDKGGNTIQLNYEGSGTNLHSLWDTKLIEHQGLTYDQLAEKYDQVSPAQISQWQKDPLIKWVWESYEISSRLYAEVDAMSSRSIGDDYYKAHLDIIRERIEQAGIRLAGILNDVFKNGPATGDQTPATAAGATPQNAPPVQTIDIKDAAKHVNDAVNVCAKVYGYKVLDGLTLVNLGAAYPDQLLTVVLKKDAEDAYAGIDGQTVCVTGKIEIYKGKPEIVITDPKLITIAGK
jgi:S1/P1 Nuclease